MQYEATRIDLSAKPDKDILTNRHVRFDCTGSHNTVVPVLGRGILSLNSRMFMSMSISTAQARPKRLSRSWGAAFLPKFSHIHVRFDCASSHKVCNATLGRGIFPFKSCIKRLLRDVHVRFDCASTRNAVFCPVFFCIKRLL